MSQHASCNARRQGRRFEDDSTNVLDLLESVTHEPVRVVAEQAPLAEVRRLLVERRVPAVAVTDPAGAIRGLVTRTDILRESDLEATAGDAMSRFVFALPAGAPVERAAALMAYENVGQVLVYGDNGALIGMVSAVDVARYLAIISGHLKR